MKESYQIRIVQLHECTIPLGIVWQDLGRIGLNEQVPKVEKESNCDYFRLKYVQNKQSLKEQIITQVQKQILLLPKFNSLP